MPEYPELDGNAMLTALKLRHAQETTQAELDDFDEQMESVIQSNPRFIDPPLSGQMPNW